MALFCRLCAASQRRAGGSSPPCMGPSSTRSVRRFAPPLASDKEPPMHGYDDPPAQRPLAPSRQGEPRRQAPDEGDALALVQGLNRPVWEARADHGEAPLSFWVWTILIGGAGRRRGCVRRSVRRRRAICLSAAAEQASLDPPRSEFSERSRARSRTHPRSRPADAPSQLHPPQSEDPPTPLLFLTPLDAPATSHTRSPPSPAHDPPPGAHAHPPSQDPPPAPATPPPPRSG